MKVIKNKVHKILNNFDHKLDEYCFYDDNSKYVVVQAIGKYDKDILWFMPRDEYEFDIKADQQMFMHWTRFDQTTLKDIYESIKTEGLHWLRLVKREIYNKK